MPTLSVREALLRGAAILHSHDIDTARLDSEVLLAFVLGMNRTDLYIKDGLIIKEDKLTEYFSMVRRRADREPVAYLTGEKEFMSLSFKVNSNVLIPRPETEILVEEALAIKPLNIIDVGTGSGAIAVSLAYYLPESLVKAVDISVKALEIAQYNAVHHGVANRIAFCQGSLLEPFNSPEFFSAFDLITANLPYIPTSEMNELPCDVRGYEPTGALDGGDDGLLFYRGLCPLGFNILRPGGVLLIEFGYRQDVNLRVLLEDAGFCKINVIKDLAGLNRVIKAVK